LTQTNTRSEATLVAGKDSKYLAASDTAGNIRSCTLHQSKGVSSEDVACTLYALYAAQPSSMACAPPVAADGCTSLPLSCAANSRIDPRNEDRIVFAGRSSAPSLSSPPSLSSAASVVALARIHLMTPTAYLSAVAAVSVSLSNLNGFKKGSSSTDATRNPN
jgi:hypothetical protein